MMDFSSQIDQYMAEATETEEPEVDEPVEDEPESEEEFGEEDEVEESDEEEDDPVEEEGFDYASWNPDDWSGNPDELPPALLSTYKTMQGGYTKKMQGLSEHERSLSAREERLFAREQEFNARLEAQKKNDDPRPANPTDDMSPDQVSQRWDEIMQWNARRAIPQEKPKQETFDAGAYVVTLPQWNQDVDAKMVEIVNSDPSWKARLTNKDGADLLMSIAIREMELESLKKEKAATASEKIREQAKSNKKRTPATKRKSRAIDEFAKTFDEKDPMKRANKIIEQSMG